MLVTYYVSQIRYLKQISIYFGAKKWNIYLCTDAFCRITCTVQNVRLCMLVTNSNEIELCVKSQIVNINIEDITAGVNKNGINAKHRVVVCSTRSDVNDGGGSQGE